MKIAVCITFFFVEERIQYLFKTCKGLSTINEDLDVTIVTNSTKDEQTLICQALSDLELNFSFFVPTGLGHPYLLTWSHFHVFRQKLEQNFTHFLYLEDDLLFTQENFEYWLSANQELQSRGLIPGFLRIEHNNIDKEWYSSDIEEVQYYSECPKIVSKKNITYLNLQFPYQGMYLLDRNQFLKHINGKSCNPDFGMWLIRESAAQGLTFVDVPEGFNSTIVLPYNSTNKEIEKKCMVHHLPNNYAHIKNANNSNIKLGSIKISELIHVKYPSIVNKLILRRRRYVKLFIIVLRWLK